MNGEVSNKTDVIVIGAGPAGISAAITVARLGKKVVLIERGAFAGSKNVFGGAIYTQPMKEIFPDFETSAPLERRNIEHKFMILGENDGTVISYRKQDEKNGSYTVIRGKFDRWMAEEAKKAGVYLVENTVVRELLIDNGKVIGIKTELEEYFADIVILADGVNSLLAKQIGLRKDLNPEDVALSVKEVIKLDKNVINERFNLKDGEGCIHQIFGGAMLGMLGLGFMYTNENSVTIGLGVTLSELIKHKLRPYDILDKLKTHPSIAPLIKDGVLAEYSAHLIPEGGYNKIPKLSSDGVMIAGDAGMLVNNLHWEGTNLAMISGKFAGEVAVEALDTNDFSADFLKKYDEKLKNSFVIKDMETYRNLMPIAEKKSKEFMGEYLKKVNEFFEMFTSVESIPKRKKYWDFIKKFVKERSFGLFSDAWYGLKLIWSILWK